MKVGVIGCGHMATAMVHGIYKADTSVKFLTYTPSFVRAKALAEKVQGMAVQTLDKVCQPDTIIIGCKPQQFSDLAKSLSQIDLSDKYIVSMMAAISIETIQNMLKTPFVTRIMPNTPLLVGKGLCLLLHSVESSEQQQAVVFDLMSLCSKCYLMPSEEVFDRATAVTGSGPAYLFYFAQAMFTKLQSWGIKDIEAQEMVTQLFLGSSELMNQDDKESFKNLIQQVASKGGVTERALLSFEQNNLSDLFLSSIDDATKRALEMKIDLN